MARFNALFPRELAEVQRQAKNAGGFEALATLELEGRDMMVKVRREAKRHLAALGVMVMEAQKLATGARGPAR